MEDMDDFVISSDDEEEESSSSTDSLDEKPMVQCNFTLSKIWEIFDISQAKSFFFNNIHF